MTHVPSMKNDTIDLRGRWLVRADPGNLGLGAEWFRQPGATEDWQPIETPCAWQMVFGSNDPAVAWYRREVTVPQGWVATRGARVWLRLEAVATDATVWVNGVAVGRHIGDWTPFQFDVTEPLRSVAPGTAEIIVRVDKVPATPPEWIDGAPVFRGHITKGFHDVLSIQHGGIWDRVSLVRTGKIAAVPDGVQVIGDAETGEVALTIELESGGERGRVDVVVEDAAGKTVAETDAPVGVDPSVSLQTRVTNPALWSPGSPMLYTARITISDDQTPRGTHEYVIRFGFRRVKTGGPNNQRLLLNGQPIFLRGVLDWGHEPRHIAPAPTPDELRGRFAYLKELGFNCVCVCMWYPPRYFYEIADEMGMLIWQEHPVWKSWMGDELIDAYKEQFVKFFRRDVNHPSVVLVSGSCEHERFNPKLAEWWWAEARRRLPDRALQIQTAFFAWTDPNKTDLWDEHTYESAGRWVRYLDDLQLALAEKTPKPFIMGESVLYTSWPDIEGLAQAAGVGALHDPALDSHKWGSLEFRWVRTDGDAVQKGEAIAEIETPEAVVEIPADDSGILRRLPANAWKGTRSEEMYCIEPTDPRREIPEMPWWYPKGLAALADFEHALQLAHGEDAVRRFREHSDRYHLLGRKFQVERFRSYANHAGIVMNHLNDVPSCRCGFMDDLGEWRFVRGQTLQWLNNAVLLLKTPSHRRGFFGGQTLGCRLGMSNFGARQFADEILVWTETGHKVLTTCLTKLECPLGEVAWTDLSVEFAAHDRPTPLHVCARADGFSFNNWTLWALPRPRSEGGIGPDVVLTLYRLAGLDFIDARDMHPDFEEHAYSSGWGLKVRSWVCPLPDPAKLVPGATPWRHDAPLPPDMTVLVTHKLTNRVLEFLRAGGRVVHLTSRTVGSVPTQYVSMWGQCPLLRADEHLGAGADEVLLDLLDYDLTRRVTRSVPTGQLGIADAVVPLVRLVYTHDMQERPRLYDSVFAARVGDGMLVVSSLDHAEDAGQWLLRELLAFAARGAPPPGPELPMTELRRWTVETAAR